MQKVIFILFSVFLIGCNPVDFKPEWTTEKSPEIFNARFETTKGNFEIEISRKNSPKAADRLYQMIKHGYYDHSIFYRVVPDFVAQFGNTNMILKNKWEAFKVPDEPVVLRNNKGTVSFARLGKDSRGLELFINFADNHVLDTLNFEGVNGFPALGKVSGGMKNVEKLYSEYAELPMNDESLYLDRGAFLQKYPKLDLINKAYLIEKIE